MIDLTTLARVRLSRGHLVHAVHPAGSRTTACGKRIRFVGEISGIRDEALPPEAAVTCHRCLSPLNLRKPNA